MGRGILEGMGGWWLSKFCPDEGRWVGVMHWADDIWAGVGNRIVTAAAIVKMLMPVRLAASAWMAPGAVRVFWRVFGRGEKAVKP